MPLLDTVDQLRGARAAGLVDLDEVAVAPQPVAMQSGSRTRTRRPSFTRRPRWFSAMTNVFIMTCPPVHARRGGFPGGSGRLGGHDFRSNGICCNAAFVIVQCGIFASHSPASLRSPCPTCAGTSALRTEGPVRWEKVGRWAIPGCAAGRRLRRPGPASPDAASRKPERPAGGTASAGAWSAGILAGAKPQKPVPGTLPPLARRLAARLSAAGRPTGLPVNGSR